MAYPVASPADIERFWRDGYLAVRDAVEPKDLDRLQGICDRLLENKDRMAFDWAWEAGTDRSTARSRSCRRARVSSRRQSSRGERFRVWATEFALGAAREGRRVLVRSVSREAAAGRRAHALAPGRGLLGPQPRRTGNHLLDALPRRRRRERLHALRARRPPRRRDSASAVENVQSDLLVCDVDPARVVPVPIKLGDVTFHHGKMPHMTTAQRLDPLAPCAVAALPRRRVAGRGRSLPWKIYVNQITGERIKPAVR